MSSLLEWKEKERERIFFKGDEGNVSCSYYRILHVPGKIFSEYHVNCEGINFYLFELSQENGGEFAFNATVGNWNCEVLGSRNRVIGSNRDDAVRYAVNFIINETVPLEERSDIEDLKKILEKAIARMEH